MPLFAPGGRGFLNVFVRTVGFKSPSSHSDFRAASRRWRRTVPPDCPLGPTADSIVEERQRAARCAGHSAGRGEGKNADLGEPSCMDPGAAP